MELDQREMDLFIFSLTEDLLADSDFDHQKWLK
jgi:hypothetical protein